jgi:hypothetical protein
VQKVGNMILTIKEGTDVKVETFDVEITNRKSEVLLDVPKTDVVIKFYWDSHGDMIPFEGFNKGYSFKKKDAHVVVTSKKMTMYGQEFESWQVMVDDVIIPCDVDEYDYKDAENYMWLKGIVGRG